MKYLILLLNIFFIKCSCQNSNSTDNKQTSTEVNAIISYVSLDTALTKIDFRGGIILNDIDSLPMELYYLKNKLYGLTIQGSRMKSLPYRMKEFKNLKEIAINNTDIEDIGILGSLIKLETIYIGGNQIKAIPSEICNLANLQKLSLDDNPIESIENISCLHTLRYLSMNRIKLAEIPNSLFKLAKLDYLSLRNNELSIVPSDINRLKELKKLYIGKNKLEKIPRELGELKNLELLDISLNKLNDVPDELFLLKSLKSILLGGNTISKEKIIEYQRFGKLLNQYFDDDDYENPIHLLPKR
jgi:Leucine-rich repeat (LRR) protein